MRVGGQVDDLPDLGLALVRQLGDVVLTRAVEGEVGAGFKGVHLHRLGWIIGIQHVFHTADPLAVPLRVVDQDLQRAAGVGRHQAGHGVDGVLRHAHDLVERQLAGLLNRHAGRHGSGCGADETHDRGALSGAAAQGGADHGRVEAGVACRSAQDTELHDLAGGVRDRRRAVREGGLGLVLEQPGPGVPPAVGADDTRLVAGEVDDDEVALAGHHHQAGVVSRRPHANRLVQVAAVRADHPEGRATVAGHGVGQPHVVAAGIGAVEEEERVALGSDFQERPGLAVHADDVADELRHPVGVLGVRGPQHSARAVRREEELPVRVEHPVLDDEWSERRQVLRVVVRVEDEVPARKPCVHVQPGGAERVVVEPDRRALLRVGVAVDVVVLGSVPILGVVRVPDVTPVAVNQASGPPSSCGGTSPPCRCTQAGIGPR